MINKNTIGSYLLAIAIGFAGCFFFIKGETETVEVPVKIEVPVPQIEVQTDTVFFPKPVLLEGKPEIQIDSALLKEYNELKEQARKDSLFKEAIKIKDYNERVEDDTLKIDLYAQVRGDLLKYQIDYTVKPRTIDLDTTLSVEIPRKPKFFLGGEAVIPQFDSPLKPSVEVGGIFVERKNKRAYKLSYDPINKTINGGIYFNIMKKIRK